MTIVFFGSSEFGQQAFERLAHEQDIRIAAVVTQPPKPSGRGRHEAPTPIAQWAEAAGIPVMTFSTLRDPAVLTTLAALKADVFLVAAYGLILPPDVLALPKYGCVNIHASRLPEYRGASPIAQAILHGDTATGISFMVMDRGVDTGPVLETHACSIESQDTTGTLTRRLADLAADHIVPCLRGYLGGTIIPKPQGGESSYASKLTVEMAHLSWDDAEATVRAIRAFDPAPGAWALMSGTRIKFFGGIVLPGARAGAIKGTIVSYDKSPYWSVQCTTGMVVPQHVQREGKKIQPAQQFPAGQPDLIGAVLD